MAVLDGPADSNGVTKFEGNRTGTLTVGEDVSMEEEEKSGELKEEECLKKRDGSKNSKKSNAIAPIDKISVHKICSGQVILNLGTALKELLENSVDAGATSVEIRLREYGATSLEVVDNGCGVEENNFLGLGLKHYTSKLKEFSDLDNMETFGFRGEALSSLCALGNLNIHTRHVASAVGSKLEFNSLGHLVKTEPSPRQVGTTVTVSNIFHSLPVRHREFLKNIKKEFSKVVTILQGYSLILTGVRVSLTNTTEKSSSSTSSSSSSSGTSKQQIFATNGNPTLKENVVNLFGVKQFQNLCELRQHSPSASVLADFYISNFDEADIDFEIDGFVSSVEHGKGRSSTDRQFFFINSRPCDSPKIFRLVNEVYRQYNRHQTPFVALRVKAKRSTIDVNVTPDKRQMFMEKEKLFLATLKTSLIQLFETRVNLYDANTLVHCAAKIGIPLDGGRPIFLGSGKDPGSDEGRAVEKPETARLNQSALDRFKFSRINDSSTSALSTRDNKPASPSPSVTSVAPKKPDEISSDSPLERLRRTMEEKRRRSQSGAKEEEEGTIEEEDERDEPPRKLMRFDTTDCDDNDCDDDDDDGFREREKETFAFFSPEPSKRLNLSILRSQTPVGDGRPDPSSSRDRRYILDHPGGVASKRVRGVEFDLGKLRKKLEKRGNSSSVSASTARHLTFRAKIDPSKNTEAEEELRREISKDKFASMTILGQFNLGFIVTKLGDDLFIIDQHATDEKYNFETLRRDTVIQSQKLILPQRLELSAAAEMTLEDNLDIFHKNGFEFEIEEEASRGGGGRVKLVAVPMSKDWNFGPSDVEEMLFMLAELNPGTLVRPSRVRKMFASRACRKAVMIGTALSKPEMKKIVDHMATLDHPWNCPHGRPTMRHLINLKILPD